MSAKQLIILQRFKSGLTQFIDELINWMPNDEELIATRILVHDQLPIAELLNMFERYLLPFESQILSRDEKFFLNDPEVFGRVRDQTRILSLKNLWLNPDFTSENKNNAWKWMDFFLKCVKLYKDS